MAGEEISHVEVQDSGAALGKQKAEAELEKIRVPAGMEFRYRFVPYGTAFSAAKGLRESAASNDHMLLFENEIAADVGGVTWGISGCEIPVIDHHFPRADGGQFPSASAAVLHLAKRIVERFRSGAASTEPGVLWLVSHRSPDFDALCALYLIRQLISHGVPWNDASPIGIHDAGWLDVPGRPKVDWFEPSGIAALGGGTAARARSMMLLAAVASCTDNGKRLGVARTRALHSILYAALRRGRPYESEQDGAIEFFDEALQHIEQEVLNPLFDSVFEKSTRFAPEIALLSQEDHAYKRDLKRAWVTVVNVQRSTVPFRELYDELRGIPLLDAGGDLVSGATPTHGQMWSQVDAIFLRDPECLLFKEWARTDNENSPSGAGFQFTAVAYSHGRPSAELNSSDYYFALDPEAASGRHLYGVWARLQAAESKALRHRFGRQDLPARAGFEGRAGVEWLGEFSDPWFDAPNYDCTIVATPNRGSMIGPAGSASDLRDDPIVQVALAALEGTLYQSGFQIQDIPSVAFQGGEPIVQHLGSDQVSRGSVVVGSGYFRLVVVQLENDVDCRNEPVAQRIGDTLWHLLMPDDRTQVPSDLRSSHVLVSTDWIGVWSRRGVALAYRSHGAEQVEKVRSDLFEISALSVEMDLLTRQSEASTEVPVSKTYSLLARSVQLQHHLSLPEGRLLRQFYEALRLGEVLQRISDLHADTLYKKQLKELQATMNSQVETQAAVEWLEVIILTVYCTELVEILLRTASAGPEQYWELAALVFVGFSTFGLTLWHLKPWKHSPRRRGGLVPVLLLLLVLAVVGFVTWEKAIKTPVRALQPSPPASPVATGAKEAVPKGETPGRTQEEPPKPSGKKEKAPKH